MVVEWDWDLSSGNLLHSWLERDPPFSSMLSMGKTTISMVIFYGKLLVYRCFQANPMPWCLPPISGGDVSDLCLNFVVTSEGKEVPLLPNGQDVPVTAENRVRYIYLFLGRWNLWIFGSQALEPVWLAVLPCCSMLFHHCVGQPPVAPALFAYICPEAM